jgi:hypothetical protein
MKLALGKRRVSMLVCLALIGIVFISIWVRLEPEPAAVRINFYTVLRIRTGMTRTDVEAIFHVPAGEYSSVEDPNRMIQPVGSTKRADLQWDFWGGDRAVLFVHFGPDGRVDDWEARLRPATPKPALDEWLDAIRYKWLGL